MRDPLAGSSWSEAGTVAGFAQSPPNDTLIEFAGRELGRGGRRLLDIGCGAGRNAVPLAMAGWKVTGTDLSWPMLEAAKRRAAMEAPDSGISFMLAAMELLPVATASADLIVAHGIWNLARSTRQFRQAVAEAARVAAPGAALFVFTFSRGTLAPQDQPVAGEEFVFTQFSGSPQVFLTPPQLVAELAEAGFAHDESIPLVEHNRRPAGARLGGGPPVIIEGTFRRSR